MTVISFDCSRLGTWSEFHREFAAKLGFPSFYGRNMDAWIDCMTYLDDPNAGMSKIVVEPGRVLTLQLENVGELSGGGREIFESLIRCTAFVNYRRIAKGDGPVLALSYFESA